MDPFRLIVGMVFLIVGIVLLFASFLFIPVFIYAVIGIVFGILLLVDFGREDKIEKIKRKKK